MKRKRRSTWRGYFWFLSPLGVISAVLTAWLLPTTKPVDNFRMNVAKIDALGCLTSSIAIIFILLPISGGGTYYQWDSPMVISMLIIGIISFVAFILVEWKWARLPIIPRTFLPFPHSRKRLSSRIYSIHLPHKRRLCAFRPSLWIRLVLLDMHYVLTILLPESPRMDCPCIGRFTDTYYWRTSGGICGCRSLRIKEEALRRFDPYWFRSLPDWKWLDDRI